MKAKKRPREAASPPKAPAAPVPIGKPIVLAVCVALAVAVLLVYAQTFHYGFIAYDDDQYVYTNARVKAGFSAAGMAWALTTFFYANWHPLTWISYMLDASLFGTNAGPFHVGNVVLHAGASVLLFLALLRMTRKPWRCAIVAGIFALHPLHVESVAWVSERKDVLSTFLEMAAFLLYARYVESRNVRRYLAVTVVFALSLMAKPMLVTFPLILLLLDFWPLRRMAWPPRWAQAKPLIVEKLPLLALSAVASILTFVAQRTYGAVIELQRLSLSDRLANAALSYVAYIGMALWPANLGALYPGTVPAAGAAILAALVVMAITAVALRFAGSRPYLLCGWLWYVGMLVPVIGIVQVGIQARADRYTYVPLVGLSFAIVWAIADWSEGRPRARRAAAVVSGVILAALAVGAYRQAGYWRDSKTLFEHTIAITQGNYIMRNNLGVLLVDDGKIQEAAALYREALAFNPEYGDAHANLGHVLVKMGQYDAAADQLREAVRLKPDSAQALGDLGLVQVTRRDYQQAAHYIDEALRIRPDEAVDHSNFCFVLLHLGQLDQAVVQCHEALRLQSDLSNAHFNLGNVLVAQGRTADARAEFARAVSLDPANAAAKQALDAIDANGSPAKSR